MVFTTTVVVSSSFFAIDKTLHIYMSEGERGNKYMFCDLTNPATLSDGKHDNNNNGNHKIELMSVDASIRWRRRRTPLIAARN